ncbi:NAD(P)H-binding protein [Streptomyces sp. H27-D2]|uniref:NAD(P)H-binding protein n=1 Tax=Streptomyces sp. H27-D2 TaxID=3046304 RepID=UPI002DB8296C|nr:NAD(P)H-binding protein [Streptomyces sp. H27-D2]MEC4019958.1 NAD(P)H-binding protein [Streptomyces sp. H27-D2]
MILVTGATGHVGRQVVTQLRGKGAAVRALVRNPATAALPDGVEVARGDLSDPSTLHAALDGVDAVFLVWPFLTADGAPAVLEAFAQHTGRIVYLSSEGVGAQAEAAETAAAAEGEDAITMFHREVEQAIERSGLEWTFLRPTGFASNTLGWAEQIRQEGVVRAPFPELARPLIHEADMAAVAVHVLTEDGHAGETYVLSGPEPVTVPEQVHAIGEALGTPVRFEERTPQAEREHLVAAGYPADFVDGILGAHAKMVETKEPVTTTIERLTGAPARSFRTWAADHADDFR